MRPSRDLVRPGVRRRCDVGRGSDGCEPGYAVAVESRRLVRVDRFAVAVGDCWLTRRRKSEDGSANKGLRGLGLGVCESPVSWGALQTRVCWDGRGWR